MAAVADAIGANGNPESRFQAQEPHRCFYFSRRLMVERQMLFLLTFLHVRQLSRSGARGRAHERLVHGLSTGIPRPRMGAELSLFDPSLGRMAQPNVSSYGIRMTTNRISFWYMFYSNFQKDATDRPFSQFQVLGPRADHFPVLPKSTPLSDLQTSANRSETMSRLSGKQIFCSGN